MDSKNAVEIVEIDDVCVISFTADSISPMTGIEAASEQIGSFVRDNSPQKMVIDFEQVKFFSSETLGLLLDIWRKLQKDGGEVVISGINPQLHRVFRITNLDKIFKFYPDKNSAVNQFNQD